ncbi:hypothetical protein IWW36_001281 [Coemansia brasiliensis]|uniref:Protein kinase domain-containing protein n=1 Tax=Coemansia brasiliensis TaxID=2650707 RepID=A0A9W8II50_9FUNG|nr:hypothetical protein IWW36_001281 [Coemansia brasiliensis]
MNNDAQSLRMHDYTVLATLGISTLYGCIRTKLEEQQNGTAEASADTPYALDETYTSPLIPQLQGDIPKSIQPHSSARKRKIAGENGGLVSATPSSRLQSPLNSAQQLDATPVRNGNGMKRSKSSTRGRDLHGSTGSKLKSAFARVKKDTTRIESDTGADAVEGRARKGRPQAVKAVGSLASADKATGMRPREYGEVWFDRYLILAKLGEGAFSQAFLAADLFCNRMGKKHDGTRLVTIKRMGAREGVIGISDYQTIAMLNRLDPKEQVPIVRVYDIFMHQPKSRRAVEYDLSLRQLMPAYPPHTGFSQHRYSRFSSRNHTHCERQRAAKVQLRVFGSGNAEDFGLQSEPDAKLGSAATAPDADDSRVCLVMEPLLGKTLHDAFPQRIHELYVANDNVVAKRMHLNMIRTVVRQLLASLAHMHKSALIHADIKTTNVICVDDASLRIKLIDFGNAVSDSDVSQYYSTFEIQTVWFRAPEVAYQRPFGRAIDIWSVGCIMCELWLGQPLFTDMNNHNLINSILKLRGPPPAHLYSASPIYSDIVRSWSGRPTPGFAPAVSDNRKKGVTHAEPNIDWEPQLRMHWLKHSLQIEDDDFVTLADALLEYDPEERPTASEALEHPFFQGMYAL